MNKKISVIYYSSAGSTAKFAESVVKGVGSVEGISSTLITINGADIIEGRYKNDTVLQQLTDSDAIIFGTPTFFGNIAAQFKAFADATVAHWFQQKWKNKIAAGFTVSGVPSGDKLSSLQALCAFAMQHSMVWVGTGELPSQPDGTNRLGSWLGAMGQADQNHILNEDDLNYAEKFGKRVAEITKQFKTS